MASNRPQIASGVRGVNTRKTRRRRSRAPDTEQRADRSPVGAAKIAGLWTVIALVGLGLIVAGLFVIPLLIVGVVFAVLGFVMAGLHYRKARGLPLGEASNGASNGA